MVVSCVLTFDGNDIRSTVSLGVSAGVPHVNGKKDELLAVADKALYKAKAQGRNRVAFCKIGNAGQTMGKADFGKELAPQAESAYPGPE
jgi:predicted signal transduction protein with EAL and GGDEF domain